jgi:uncharacterized oligopeptide transporter (OPT) family protein
VGRLTGRSPEARDAAPREITPRAIALGLMLALLLGAANAYLGLYAGLTVSASIPAAVISMAVLRALGGATILENNVVQTIASAGEAVAAGAIFTFPALVVLGETGALPYRDVTMLCAAGATMGSLLVVFLRRAYIVEERLPFPEGVACAEVLRAGEAGGASALPLLWGGLAAAALKASRTSSARYRAPCSPPDGSGRACSPDRPTSRPRFRPSAISSAFESRAWSSWAAPSPGWSQYQS